MIVNADSVKLNETSQINSCIYASSCEQLKKLTAELEELLEKNRILSTNLSESKALNEKLAGMLKRQLDDRFNKHSEKAKYINPDENKNSDENCSITEKDEQNIKAQIEIEQTKKAKVRNTTPHGRVIPENIPVIEEIIEIPEGESVCNICGKGYRKTTMCEESSEIDIEITIVRKKIKRVKYAKNCVCEASPEIITAEKPANIIYKSLYSTSLWVLFLMLKYCVQIPIYRQISKIWNQYGVEFKNSTIMGGFKKLHAVLIPLYNAMIEKSKTEEHWHADETCWKVFTDKQGKKTFNWWMWVFASAKVVVYILDRTRSSTVPQKHLEFKTSGILNVDRYSAYRVLTPMLSLALCWYHVRRDFIKASTSYPQLGDWTKYWLGLIGELETINDIRLEAFVQGNPEFILQQSMLEDKVAALFSTGQEQLDDPMSTEAQKKVLKSLLKNKEGLSVFVDNPLVPMHNNLAERSLRPLALARDNFYGSRASWSGELAAICMSIYMTAHLHNLNPQAYIEYYFHVCAKNNSNAPDDIESLLFWNLSDDVIDTHNLRIDKTIAS